MSSDPTAAPGTPANGSPPPDPNAIDWAPYTRFAALAAILGLVLYGGAGVANLNAAPDGHAREEAQKHFAGAYLSGYTYWLSLPIGAMALLMIGYLAKASWNLFLRRFFEAASRTWLLFFALFVPLAFVASNEHYSPYWWTTPETAPTPPDVNTANPGAGVDPANKRAVTEKYGEYMIKRAVEEEEKAKAAGNNHFLSPRAFVGVGIALYLIWGGMIFYLNKWGREAEGSRQNSEGALSKIEKLSGPGVIVYAITITAAASQWVMSLEAGWASTMFPVIFAVNQFLTCFALCLALFLVIASRPPIKDLMRPKFQLDMGTLMLAFTLFWTYTSFSQFMLVWIGNLPEEIPFFLKRSSGGWWWVSAALAALHFALPFLLLLFRDIKLHPKRLRIVAIYLCVICAVDVVWWVAPASPQSWDFYWLMDAGAVVGIGGLWGLFFIWQLKQRSIFPTEQTFMLPEGHHHEHH